MSDYITSLWKTLCSYLSTIREYAQLIRKTWKRDIKLVFTGYRALFFFKWVHFRNQTVISRFESSVKKHPDKPCFICEDRVWTFKDVDEYSNRVANYFQNSTDITAGDVVALNMGGSPEYVCIWLGLAKLGVKTALINYNLVNQQLLHCIEIVTPKAVIFGVEFEQNIKDIQDKLDRQIVLYAFGGDSHIATNLNKKLAASAVELCSFNSQPIKTMDTMLYIYTSGTTGMPKAAKISHFRYLIFATGPHRFADINSKDTVYVALPLYHTAGCQVGIGQALGFGTTVVIRKKFSASNFWLDCKKHNCTVAIYVGELCRYLLAQPEGSHDKDHKIRAMFGNGFRPQLWSKFRERFAIDRIIESYGATEGTASLVNYEGKVPAVGYLLRYLTRIYPVSLIKVDNETGEPIRDDKGMCIRCNPGEPGQIVCRIDQNNPYYNFVGYANKSATEKKIITNVFKKGDKAFASGDILVMDELGYFTFLDRTGDTFRWKGENVSTTEVESILSKIFKYKDCIVYGVEIPNYEGKAGMATVVDENGDLDVNQVAKFMDNQLPVYSRPVFLRTINKIPMTGTFKLKKFDLQKESFDPDCCSANGKIYYLDTKANQYQPLDGDMYRRIKNSEIRF